MNASSDKRGVALMLLTNKKGAETMPIKKCQKKDGIDSFEQLALPHMSLIYRLAYRLSGKKEDAEDLTQETFRIAFEKFDQLRDKEKCRNWLVMILKNLFFKDLRKKKRFPSVNLDDIAFNLAENKDFNSASIREVSNGELQQTLNKLDERYKTPLVLSYIDGFSYKEIASILNIPMGTVMSRIARGKIFLKKEFSKKTGPLYSRK
jgi:RNA polymerase sigma-70 factor (ECF subfamily)